ncbi:MAG: zinc ribbon domain-containing protein [Fusobacteriaceae bacterium]|nr:zinc ribbon domain-containing protein [Fusobacteriaceae bacterium]
MDGTYIIKDLEYRNEMIQLYQKSIISEAHKEMYEPEGIDTIFCPKCGKKYEKNTAFCLACGKDLRLL